MGADKSSSRGVKIIGIAAHIRAAAPGGPRFDAKQTQADRASIENGIWLCASCSQLIDKNGGRDFPAQTLEIWKRSAERSSANALLFAGSRSRPDWIDRIHYAQFINVPRLGAMLGGGNLVCELGLDESRGFREQGLRLVSVLHWLESALTAASIEALSLDDILPPSGDFVGQIISFDHRCYTRNGAFEVDPLLLAEFDPRRTPHFYIKTKATKFIFPYDPLWVTTSTAYSDFRSGHQRFAGLGLMKSVRADLTEVTVSPLVVAFPRNKFMQEFYSSF